MRLFWKISYKIKTDISIITVTNQIKTFNNKIRNGVDLLVFLAFSLQFSGIMECTCMLFTFENGVPLMRQGASVVWHHSLLLINSFNKTEAAVFSYRLCFLRAFPFISLASSITVESVSLMCLSYIQAYNGRLCEEFTLSFGPATPASTRQTLYFIFLKGILSYFILKILTKHF